MKRVECQIATVGDGDEIVFYLRPVGVGSLSEKIRAEGLTCGDDVVLVASMEPTNLATTYVTEVRAILDGVGEPAEVLREIERWWDSKP